MKQITSILFTLLFISISSIPSFCSDITINIKHATGNNSNGSIEIVLDDNNNGPYTYILTGPVSANFTNSDLTNTINNLPKGDYCLLVTNADGCTAEICFTIKKCRYWKGRYFCNEVVSIPHTPSIGFVMLVGHDDDDGTLKEDRFDISTTITSTQLDNILPTIMNTTSLETENLLNTGYSQFLVSEQNEVPNDDVLFVYMFNQNGGLEWVYYAGQNANPDRQEPISTRSDKELGSHFINVNPNPVYSDLNIDLSPQNKFEYLNIYNSIGQLQTTKKIGSLISFTLDLEDLQSGIYFIRFVGNNEQETVKFIKA